MSVFNSKVFENEQESSLIKSRKNGNNVWKKHKLKVY